MQRYLINEAIQLADKHEQNPNHQANAGHEGIRQKIIKTMMGYYNNLAKTKKADMEQLTLIYVADKSVNLFLENSLAESIMGNCKSCCLRIPLLGIYLTKIDVYLSEDFYKSTCKSTYIVASHWEQTQCLSANTVTFLDLFMDK